MAFLNNDGQFTDESLSLLMRDLRGFITATDGAGYSRPHDVKISKPTIHDTKQILEDEYVLSDELCKGCSCDCTSSNLGRQCEKDNKYDICWYKAHQHAKALLESLSKLV